MFEFILLVLVIAAGYGVWWYYNNKLSPVARKAVENEVKADVKEAVAEVKQEAVEVVAKVEEKVVKAVKRGGKKKTNG